MLRSRRNVGWKTGNPILLHVRRWTLVYVSYCRTGFHVWSLILLAWIWSNNSRLHHALRSSHIYLRRYTVIASHSGYLPCPRILRTNSSTLTGLCCGAIIAGGICCACGTGMFIKLDGAPIGICGAGAAAI